jgi:hypothetical protein
MLPVDITAIDDFADGVKPNLATPKFDPCEYIVRILRLYQGYSIDDAHAIK